MSFTLPTEMVDLPSKGLLYPESNPLSSGQVEIKYMTAKEEDILTNQSYIAKGTVIDKLLQSLIVSKINYNDLLIGDKNAIMLAARILGYGPEYEFIFAGKKEKVDLTQIGNKTVDESLLTKGKNEFAFTLPHTENQITFKLLTHGDEQKIAREIEGLKKLQPDGNAEVSTRLKHSILSVNGDSDPPTIRKFVDQALLARDARAYREYVNQIQPDIDLTFFPEGRDTKRPLPIGINFFYPDA